MRAQARLCVGSALMATVMVFAGCGDDDDGGSDASTTAAAAEPTTSAAAADPTTSAPAAEPTTTAAAAPTTTAPVEVETLTIGTVTANGVDQSALLVGKDQGIFEGCGIDLQFQAFNSNPDVLRASTTGATDLSWAGPNGVIAAFHNGEDLQIVSGGFLGAAHLGWVVPVDSDVNTVADLAGRKIGVPSPLGPADSALRFILEQEGIEAESVVVGGIQDGLAAMASGQVDATYMGDPTLTSQVNEGNVKVVMLVDDYTEYQTAVVVGPTSYVEANADTIDRFLDCVDVAFAFVKDNPAEAAAIFAEVGGIDPEVSVDVIEFAIDRGAYSREVSEEALGFALEQSKVAGAVPPEYTRADLDPLFVHLRAA